MRLIFLIALLISIPNATYSNCISGDCYNGLGYFEFDDQGKHKYIGFFKSGMYNGPGVEFRDGVLKSGIWNSGQFVEPVDIETLDIPEFFIEDHSLLELKDKGEKSDTRVDSWFDQWLNRTNLVISIIVGLITIYLFLRGKKDKNKSDGKLPPTLL